MLSYLRILKLKRVALFLTIVLALLIAVSTLTPLPTKIDVPGSDKWHHFVAFAVLVFPLAYCNKRYAIVIAIAALGYGGFIEIVQPYVNRYGEFNDFVADGIGVCIGIVYGHGFVFFWRFNALTQKSGRELNRKA